MKLWLRTYWSLALIAAGYAFMWLVLVGFLVTGGYDNGLFFLTLFLLSCGIIGVAITAAYLQERRAAFIVLDSLNDDEVQSVMRTLAANLQRAFDRNIRIQTGQLEPTKEEKRHGRIVEEQKDRFWTAAHLLSYRRDLKFPKSYKEHLVADTTQTA